MLQRFAETRREALLPFNIFSEKAAKGSQRE